MFETLYLNTAAGSTLLILLNANDAPLNEIKAMVENMANKTNGENEKINPDFATPILKLSNNAKPIKNPTTVNNIA